MLSKTVNFIIDPINFLSLLSIFSILFIILKLKKLANYLIFFLIFIIFTTSIIPFGTIMLKSLEKEYYNSLKIDEVDGILILGGIINPSLSKKYKTINLGDNSERIFESINLIKKFPKTKIVFSGGNNNFKQKGIDEATFARKFYDKLNIDTSKIIFENKSSNTIENILFSKNIVLPNKNEKWIVITSAFHMKRTLIAAKKLEWNLIPYPVDFKTSDEMTFLYYLNFGLSLKNFKIAFHEYLGIFAYSYLYNFDNYQ